MERVKRCTKDCPERAYSRSLARCRFGKINPPTAKAGVETARLMGLSYICRYAWHRAAIEKALLATTQATTQADS